MRRLVVCADDFGASGPVDAGILRLAEAGRVTAVSCLAEGPAFRGDAARLLASPADAGLHLDLTEGYGGAPPAALGAFIARSLAGRLDPAALRRRIAAQFDAFERIAGRPPAFVDGHRHVHQLPGVRAPLLDELARRYPGRPPPVRVTVPSRWRGAKAALIAALGGRGLRRRLEARGVPHNADFCGVYGFDPRAGYRELARGWLATVADGGLLMCHPGEAGGDVIAEARVVELAYLGSPEFEADCREAGVERCGAGLLAALSPAPASSWPPSAPPPGRR